MLVRILLISPTHYNADGTLHKTTRYWTSGITLPYLKALTPPGHEVSIVDELFYDVDLEHDVRRRRHHRDGPADQARLRPGRPLPRAAAARVVLGGTWVTLTAEAVAAARRRRRRRRGGGRLAAAARRLLRGPQPRHLPRRPLAQPARPAARSTTPTLPLLKYDAFQSSWLYRMYFHWPVIFSRGCPHPCEYCAVQTYYQRSFRTRPVDDVIEDLRTIKALGANRILFLDDNPIAHPEAAKELFRAMIPLRLKWASQSTINIARDPELLDLAARSGCVSLSIGLESINEDEPRLGQARASICRAASRRDLAAIRGKGIQVIALLMVGLDGDTRRHLPALARSSSSTTRSRS